MKEERKVLATKSIVDLAENAGVAEKLSTWADWLKYFLLVCCIIVLIGGFCMLPSFMGLWIILLAILNGFLTFFYFHLLRAGAIVTEAASIFVLEHKGENDFVAKENKELKVQQEEKPEENTEPFEVGEEVVVIKSGISTTIKGINGDEITLSNGIFGDTFKVSASEIRHKK